MSEINRFYQGRLKLTILNAALSAAIAAWSNYYFFEVDMHKLDFKSDFTQYHLPMYFYMASSVAVIFLANMAVYQYIRYSTSHKEIISGDKPKITTTQSTREFLDEEELMRDELNDVALVMESCKPDENEAEIGSSRPRMMVNGEISKMIKSSSRHIDNDDDTRLYENIIKILQKSRKEWEVRWKTSAYVIQLIISTYTTIMLLVVLLKYQLPAYNAGHCQYIPEPNTHVIPCAFIHSEYILYAYSYIVAQYVFELGVLNTRMNRFLMVHHMLGALYVSFILEYGNVKYKKFGAPTMLLGMLQYISGTFEQFIFLGMFVYRYYKKYAIASYFMQIGFVQFVISKLFVTVSSFYLIIYYWNVLETPKALTLAIFTIILALIQARSIFIDYPSIIKTMESKLSPEHRTPLGRCLNI